VCLCIHWLVQNTTSEYFGSRLQAADAAEAQLEVFLPLAAACGLCQPRGCFQPHSAVLSCTAECRQPCAVMNSLC